MDKPTYVQIFDSLCEEIESGSLQPGDQLPSERSLSLQLKVSRMTVRQALNVLVNRGLAYRRSGIGTFVATPKVQHQVDSLISFSESLEKSGLKQSIKLLSMDQERAQKTIASKLQVNIGSLIYVIQRVRMQNGDPISLEYSYLPASLCPQIEQFDLEHRSIYEILEDEYGVQIEVADQYFEPVVANNYESEILSVPINTPLMLISHISYNTDGHAIEYGKDIYRGDKTRFVFRSPRRRKQYGSVLISQE